MRNSTVSACARALGVTVNDLLILPVDRLLAKMRSQTPADGKSRGSLLERATQPELIAWIERNPERASELTPEEMEELLDLQQESGGPLSFPGVEHYVLAIERKRKLIEQVHTIAGTEFLDLLEQVVDLIYEKVQPYRDRT